MAAPASFLALMGLTLLAACSASSSMMHDRTRGMAAMGHTKKEIAAVKASRSSEHATARIQNKEAMEEHPTVANFKAWKQMRKENHPAAASAWAGDMPAAYVPEMLEKMEHHVHHMHHDSAQHSEL